MRVDERAVTFDCDGDWLHGVLSRPDRVHPRGVLIVVGGPQYRAGSHRQFTLLARYLAGQGIAAMRFDLRGMGDSEGTRRAFDDTADDIGAAVTHFMAAVPQLSDIAIWGLCDGASAALLYAPCDPRVTALVLLNPWARSEQGHAKTVLKHYYAARLRDPAFWRKLAKGGLRWRDTLASLGAQVRGAMQRVQPAAPAAAHPATLPQRLYLALQAYQGRLLLLTCDPDLTAQEFLEVANSSPWRALLATKQMRHQRLADADHTCSTALWRDDVAAKTASWIMSW